MIEGLEERFAVLEDRIGRPLTTEEKRLLAIWEALAVGAPMDGLDEAAAEAGPAEHDGRFKIIRVKDRYEVLFVCTTIMLRAVLLDSRDDVIAFLTQDPIFLDQFGIEQALASADALRPAQIPQDVRVSEPMLRSMGFEHR